MPRSTRLPSRFPMGTKYVLEACGPVVLRYIEFPNGRRIKLATREVLPCTCAERQTTIAPEHNADAFAVPTSPRIVV